MQDADTPWWPILMPILAIPIGYGFYELFSFLIPWLWETIFEVFAMFANAYRVLSGS